VVRRMVADDVHHRGRRAACVVDVRDAVRVAGTAVEQRRGGPPRHPGVAVGAPGDDGLRQAEHAAHPRNPVERGHEMHLGRAGIREAMVDAACEQRSDEAFCTVHGRVCRGVGRGLKVAQASGRPAGSSSEPPRAPP
jgi:hypothetical protein